ncbi:hypothetical protein CAPTEDRAFT_118145, partial [Capitella teleta]
MTKPVTIRLATREDAETITKMLINLAQDMGDGEIFASTEDTIREHGFGADPKFYTFIAEAEGHPVGMALFFRYFSTTRGMPGGFVHDLWVAPSFRGQGLGTKLISAVATHSAKVWG